MPDELGDAVAVAGPDPSSDAGTDRDRRVPQHEWLEKRGAYARLRGADLGVFADVRQDDRELVPAEARNNIASASDRLQALRSFAQQLIATLVAIRIVDLLE